MQLKNLLHVLTLFLVSIFVNVSVLAQPIFQHYTSEDGLSENVVNVIYQDDLGYMWFGTNDGLNKFDGYQFDVFTPDFANPGSISSNLIYALTSDKEGNLWVGTTGAGINKFNPQSETFTTYRHDPENKGSLGNDQIVNLFTDSRGWIWIASTSFISVFDPAAEKIVFSNYGRDELNRNVVVRCFTEDKKGNVYAGTQNGILKIKDAEKIEDISFENIKFDKELGGIVGMAYDHFDHLVVTAANGIYYINQVESNSEALYLGNYTTLNDIVVDQNNEIWIGSYYGIIHLTRDQRTMVPEVNKVYRHLGDDENSINKNLVVSLFQDKNGIIWAGINGGGVNKFDPDRKPFRHVSRLDVESGGNEKIRAVLEDSRGGLWVGTEGDGLFYKAQFSSGFRKIESATSVFALAEIEKNNKKWIYIGSENEPTLQRIEMTGSQVGEPENVWTKNASVFAIMQDEEGQLWIGTYNKGLFRYSLDKNYEIFDEILFASDMSDPNSISNDIIRKLLQDNKGNVWVGTGNGLSMIPSQQTQADEISFSVYNNMPGDPSSLSYSYILDILESETTDLWVGTFGGGLNKLNRNKAGEVSFETIDEKDGLPNSSVKSLLEDQNGRLWISTNKGLSLYNPKTKKLQNFHKKDGLQSNEFLEVAATRLNNGELLFGGVNGYNIFDPMEIETSTLQPNLVFSNIKVVNKNVIPGQEVNGRVILKKSIAYAEEVALRHNESNFSIAFSALDFSAPEQIMYSYILEGFDDKWTETTAQNRNATYTNVPAGNYVFKVKSTNGDGVWNDEYKSLEVSVKPPFWLTWYAYIMYGAAAFGLLWFLRKYELIGIQEKHRLTVDGIERQKRDEVQDLKLNFFTNISHELRTPLTLIIAPLENLMQNGRSMKEEKVSEQYHLIFKNAKYLLRLVDQLLDFRKLDQGKLDLKVRQGDIVKFVKEATEPFQFLANKNKIEFSVSSEDTKTYLWFDPEVVEKVLYNLLSNAFKFTPDGGNINVHLKEVELSGEPSKKGGLTHYLQIEVKDSGIGISSKVSSKIFERFYKEGGDKFTKDGAGIGLAFAQSLVKRHYGSISVDSKKGEGSNFIVKLPMKKSSYSRAEIENKKLESSSFTTDPLEYFSPERPAVLPVIAEEVQPVSLEQNSLPLLLFVEDNADIRKFIRSGFEDDFRIIDAENGVKGLELAKSSIPDIIISDIMMPEMDGIELCNHLKKDIETSHIPVVLLTAKTNVESEIEGLETGADAYVKKPFKLEVLKQQIINIYSQREKLKSRFRQEILLQPSEITVTSADEEFLKRAMDLIEEHMSDAEFNVEALVKEMFISRSKLYLKIKALTGQSTSEFIRTIRLKRAVQLLEKSDYTIKEIMFMTGFNTASYFSKCFKKQYGIVPSEYMNSREVVS